MKMNAT